MFSGLPLPSQTSQAITPQILTDARSKLRSVSTPVAEANGREVRAISAEKHPASAKTQLFFMQHREEAKLAQQQSRGPPLKERISTIGKQAQSLFNKLKNTKLPPSEDVQKKFTNALNKTAQFFQTSKAKAKETLSAARRLTSNEVKNAACHFSLSTLSATLQITKSTHENAKKVFNYGKSLGARAKDRIAARGGVLNSMAALRCVDIGIKMLNQGAHVVAITAAATAPALSILSTVTMGALIPVGYALVGLLVYSNLQKLWTMDNPIALLREKVPLAAKFIHAKLPDPILTRLKAIPVYKATESISKIPIVGNLISKTISIASQSFKKTICEEKERMTQYGVAKRELARLKVKLAEGGLTAEEKEKYYVLKVVTRKLFYRRLHCAVYLAQAAVIAIATTVTLAGLFAGPAAPIVIGIGMGLGIGAVAGTLGLRLAIFAVRRVRRHFINDTPDGEKSYITGDEMRLFLRAKLREDMKSGATYSDLKSDHIDKWSSGELAMFLLMKGNRNKTKFTLKNEEGKIKLFQRNDKGRMRLGRKVPISAEEFRDALFKKDDSQKDKQNNHAFNGAWKKAFGG